MSLEEKIRKKFGKSTIEVKKEEPKEIKVITQPKVIRESTITRTNVRKTELKKELRKLIHTLGSGHKLYEQLGYSNIIDVKARIHEIIDKL